MHSLRRFCCAFCFCSGAFSATFLQGCAAAFQKYLCPFQMEKSQDVPPMIGTFHDVSFTLTVFNEGTKWPLKFKFPILCRKNFDFIGDERRNDIMILFFSALNKNINPLVKLMRACQRTNFDVGQSFSQAIVFIQDQLLEKRVPLKRHYSLLDALKGQRPIITFPPTVKDSFLSEATQTFIKQKAPADANLRDCWTDALFPFLKYVFDW